MIDGTTISPKMAIGERINVKLNELAIPSICDKCVHSNKCASERKACKEFTQFVETIPGAFGKKKLKEVKLELAKNGSKRIPTRDIYKQHFVR